MASDAEPHVLFELAGTAYALPARTVERMEMVELVTPVPNAAPFVDGVIFSRGQVVPALNLRRRFGFEKVPYDVKTRLIVVAHEGRTVGLIVDSAREFVSVPADAIQPAPESLVSTSGRYLRGIAQVGNRVILILDLGGVLTITATTDPS